MNKSKKYKVAIIGGGPAGCACAYFLQEFTEVAVFEKNKVLNTLLPTGGGRCNLAHYEFNVRNLAANYPRGEKFLYSVFSRFATAETLEFFAKIGVETYVQEDMRIFPRSNSSADVRQKFLQALTKVKIRCEQVKKLVRQGDKFVINDDLFDFVVVAVGGHAGYTLATSLGHKIIAPKPALTALKTQEDFSSVSGVSVAQAECNGQVGDLLFTHRGISGPLVYKISSLKAQDVFPYVLCFNLCSALNLQEQINHNPQKSLKNLLAESLPKSLAVYILQRLNIDGGVKAGSISGKTRDKIADFLQHFAVHVNAPTAGCEVVTCGGVDLDEVSQKTLESKLVKNVHFCGEVLNIDGFCGGFNLQNCWSTAYCAAEAIKDKLK